MDWGKVPSASGNLVSLILDIIVVGINLFFYDKVGGPLTTCTHECTAGKTGRPCQFLPKPHQRRQRHISCPKEEIATSSFGRALLVEWQLLRLLITCCPDRQPYIDRVSNILSDRRDAGRNKEMK